MEAQKFVSPGPFVRATLHLGSETYNVQADKGVLSEQVASMKEQSMSILKEFITKHNVPTDVPDEPDEISSDDEDINAPPENPPKKPKSKELLRRSILRGTNLSMYWQGSFLIGETS